FDGCSGLTSLDVSHFNTAKVTTMEAMFKGCSGLTSLVVSNFNTENVTNMYEMFSGCSRLTNLEVSNFNTAKVTDMGEMFRGCSRLTKLDVSNFNTANVKNMNFMFYLCSGLTKLDVTHFNTAKVTKMMFMFSGCSRLTNLDVSNFNTANVTRMDDMFSGCSSLTNLDVSKFNTANVTNMNGMFKVCSGLTKLDVSNFNTAKVTDMALMFYSCSGLTSLTFGENFTTASCTSYGLIPMFYGCSRLRYLDFYASNDDNTHAFKEANLNRNGASSAVLFGKEVNGLPLTTVIYMPHGIKKSDYTNYTDLPNLVFNDGGILKAANYYSEDKVDIELPRKFKTTKAEYSRTMNAATQYGTVILPYEFTTNESVQAYLLRAEHTGTMWYEEVESVPAHTPFFYSKKTESDTNVNFNKTVANYGITVEATHTTSNAEGGQPYDAASGMDGWTTKGYYITETVDASSGNTYYISGDKFWRATGTLKMYPHRVTYQGQWQYDPDATEAPAMLNIITMGASETGDDLPSEVSTAIEAAHLRSLQQNARDIYDAQGRRQSELKSGLNIVRMADGTTVKIVKR
ncbi:MAG: BspA family leucine-rich repeat surface protein, partial [Prevotella sp.]|nr:BspA family leucine-rich repeat surface protein [Prevotella sp.]